VPTLPDVSRPVLILDNQGPKKYWPVFDLLNTNNDQDAYLRQAAVTALVRMTDQPCTLLDGWKDAGKNYDTPAVRLGLVLALRKLQCRRLGEFLADADPRVVAEAARAIYDQELMTPMADLAKLADKPGLPEPVAYRAVAANFKLGDDGCAARIARFAARASEPAYLRAFALKLLADWPALPRRDAITGLTQSLEKRPAQVAAEALKAVVQSVFTGPDLVRQEAVKAVSRLGVKEVGPLMLGLVKDAAAPAATRVEALLALAAIKDPALAAGAEFALASPEPRLRGAARVVKARTDEAAAAKELPALLKDDKATDIEKQMALGALGGLKESKEADAALAEWMDQLQAGKVPDALKLDVLEAAQARANSRTRLHAPLREKVQAYDQAARAAVPQDPLARYRETLAGGDAEKGRQIFLNNAAVYCQRCHQLDGQGGEVGPPVNGIARDKTREYLLESIVAPNRQIAKGFESVTLTLFDGRTVSGVLKAEDKKEIKLVTAENQPLTIKVEDVELRRAGKSAMPEDLHTKLTKRELRDVVEFLAGLKEPAKK
jgi:quinoprotein glucose dehydrogenase